MKSVMINGPRSFEIVKSEPKLAKEGYILIEVIKAGICGSDIHYWESGEPKGLIMGHEFSGIVLDSADSTKFKAGDKVTALPISPCMECENCKQGNIQICNETWTNAIGLSLNNPGGFGSRVLVREDMVHLLDERITFEEGAMIEPAAVALRAVNVSNVKQGDKCLVIGGGIIGLLTAEFLKMKGASYVALTEINKLRAKKAVKLGVVDEWFKANDEKLLEKLLLKTDNLGFDVVCDCCGNSSALTSAIMFTKGNGNLTLVGISLDNVSIPLIAGIMKELNIKGSIGYKKEEFEEIINLVKENKIDLEKYIDDVITLDELQAAFERLTDVENDDIKILVDPNKSKIIEL